jgi:hypothetical protein
MLNLLVIPTTFSEKGEKAPSLRKGESPVIPSNLNTGGRVWKRRKGGNPLFFTTNKNLVFTKRAKRASYQ